MSPISDVDDRFVSHLEALREDRGAMANLRRGLGKVPGTVAEMHPLLLPWLPSGIPRQREDACYLLAALFGSYPSSGGQGTRTLGASFRRLANRPDSASIERRFVCLLNAHADDLPGHLRHAVSLLKSEEIPVDWRRLLTDIRHWDHPDRWVQRRWARDFWGGPSMSEDQEQTADVAADAGKGG